LSYKDDFGDMMKHTVFIQSVASSDGWGPTYGEGANHQCLIKKKIQNIKLKDGTETVSHCQIHLDGSVVVNASDKITYQGESPPILRVDEIDELGVPYKTVIYT